MKKFVKKALSFSMTAVMAFTLNPLAGLSVSAKAADSKVEAAVEWACMIAEDDSHGYSNASEACGFRSRTGPDYDCSSFVTAAFMNAGFDGISIGNADEMKSMFVNAGFQWIPASECGGLDDESDSEYLQRGDILLSIGSHTELYVGDGKSAGAHWDWDGEEGGYGDYRDVMLNGVNYYRCGADEINVQKAYLRSYNYDGVLRYGSSVNSLGDVNSDGAVNSSDALLVLQHSVGKTVLKNDRFTRADVNRDNTVNSSDALKILQYSVGEIKKL